MAKRTPAPEPALALRGDLLGFEADGRAVLRRDAALLIDTAGRVVGAAEGAAPCGPGVVVRDLRGKLLAPGFVDCHVHAAQLDVIGSPADGLLPWLERYTFPAEARFADPAHAEAQAGLFLDELLRHGVTTALAFCTSHRHSVEALFQAGAARGLCLIAGKVLQDRHSPPALQDDTEGGLRDTADLLAHWHGRGRLGYAITPRFAPTSSPRQLAGAAELARAHPDVWVQTHVAESHAEDAWARALFPEARSYLDIYDRAGLLRRRAVYAHCLHLSGDDRRRLAESGAAMAVCPTSNLFLGSGLFDFAAARQFDQTFGLASDVGAGTSLSPFRTMLAAYEVARLQGQGLSPSALWFAHTRGAARALDLEADVGDLRPGCFADVVVLDPRATPLLARRSARCETVDELLFALLTLGDDRAVVETLVAGRPVTF